MKKFTFIVVLTMFIIIPKVSQAYILDGVSQFNGHYYKVFNYGMYWEDAKKFCEDIGGHLVTITSKEENIFVTNLISNFGKNCYWIGSKLNHNNKMSWITNENMNYSNWSTGEPDNYQGKQGYAFIEARKTNDRNLVGKWGDIKYDASSPDNYYFWGLNNFGLVCEWESLNSFKVRY